MTHDGLLSMMSLHKETIRVLLKALRDKDLLVRDDPDKAGLWEFVEEK